VSAVAEAHGLHPTQLYRWRRLYGRKPKGNSGAALLAVRVAEERMEHSRPTRKASHDEPGATRPATIHLEFAHARVRVESADGAMVLAILERLAR
jgi:transposase-like protein